MPLVMMRSNSAHVRVSVLACVYASDSVKLKAEDAYSKSKA